MTLNDMYFGLLEGGGNLLRILGIIIGIIVLVVLFCTLDIVEIICVGIAVIIFIPIMIILDKRKKKRKEEPWKHSDI